MENLALQWRKNAQWDTFGRFGIKEFAMVKVAPKSSTCMVCVCVCVCLCRCAHAWNPGADNGAYCYQTREIFG